MQVLAGDWADKVEGVRALAEENSAVGGERESGGAGIVVEPGAPPSRFS